MTWLISFCEFFSAQANLTSKVRIFAGKMASQIDVHVAKRHIYWCDQGNKDSGGAGIHRRGTDGAGYQRIVSTGIGAKGIKGLAIDWIAGTFNFFLL